MRTLALFIVSLLSLIGCRDDDTVHPLPCATPTYDYNVRYDFENAGASHEPYWLIISDPDGYPRIVRQASSSQSDLMLDEETLCFDQNPLTAIFSNFQSNQQRGGYISIETFTDVPNGSRLERNAKPLFARAGSRPPSTITITNVPAAVEEVDCPYITNFDYDEATGTLTLYTTSAFILESDIWVKIKPVGSSIYYCRAFTPHQDFGESFDFDTFTHISLERSIAVDHPTTLTGWWEIYGMSSEHDIQRASIGRGNFSGDNLIHVAAPEDAFPYYIVKIVNFAETGDLIFYDVFTELPNAIIPNEVNVSASYTGSYPDYEITATNADLIEISFSTTFEEETVSFNWKVYLPGHAQQSINLPRFTDEIISSLPYLGQVSFTEVEKIYAYNFHELAGYEEVQPYLFKKVDGELWDFRSRYVKVNAAQ